MKERCRPRRRRSPSAVKRGAVDAREQAEAAEKDQRPRDDNDDQRPGDRARQLHRYEHARLLDHARIRRPRRPRIAVGPASSGRARRCTSPRFANARSAPRSKGSDALSAPPSPHSMRERLRASAFIPARAGLRLRPEFGQREVELNLARGERLQFRFLRRDRSSRRSRQGPEHEREQQRNEADDRSDHVAREIEVNAAPATASAGKGRRRQRERPATATPMQSQTVVIDLPPACAALQTVASACGRPRLRPALGSRPR